MSTIRSTPEMAFARETLTRAERYVNETKHAEARLQRSEDYWTGFERGVVEATGVFVAVHLLRTKP